MEVFSNDDEGYRKWLAENPNGYVVNTYTNPSPDYMMLHRANCQNGILSHQHSNPTQDYKKWCSLERFELLEGVLEAAGGGSLTDAGCCIG